MSETADGRGGRETQLFVILKYILYLLWSRWWARTSPRTGPLCVLVASQMCTVKMQMFWTNNGKVQINCLCFYLVIMINKKKKKTWTVAYVKGKECNKHAKYFHIKPKTHSNNDRKQAILFPPKKSTSILINIIPLHPAGQISQSQPPHLWVTPSKLWIMVPSNTLTFVTMTLIAPSHRRSYSLVSQNSNLKSNQTELCMYWFLP